MATNRVDRNVVSKTTTISTTAAAIPTTAYADRKFVLIQNKGAATVYIGGSDVSSTNGFELASGSEISFDASDGAKIYAVTASGSADIRTLEGR